MKDFNWQHILVYVSALIIFAANAFVPFGVTVPILYLILIVWCSKITNDNYFPAVCLIFTWLNIWLNFAGAATSIEYAVLNRCFTTLAIVIVSWNSYKLKKAENKLIQSNRDLEQFAYVTSHDLRSPLRGISNLAVWIEEDLGSLPPPVKKNMELLKDRVLHMDALIDGVLQYSRIGRVHLEQELVDTKTLINDIIDVNKKDGFKFNVSNLPKIYGNKTCIHQLFANLISNAVQHHNKETGTIAVSVKDLKNFYEFTIEDDGPGIEPRYHERIFQMFQTLQTKDTSKGTGIGLALVKKIINDAGETIRVESVLGVGSKFIFTWRKP